jgi:hypothetical protein
MDKNIHKDIGNWFSEEIEPMQQAPRKQVWEALEQQLDKEAASTYKRKFITFRRLAALLLFLLLGVATYTIVQFAKTKDTVTAKEGGNNNTEKKPIPVINNTPAGDYSSQEKNNSPVTTVTNRQQNSVTHKNDMMPRLVNTTTKAMVPARIKETRLPVAQRSLLMDDVTDEKTILENTSNTGLLVAEQLVPINEDMDPELSEPVTLTNLPGAFTSLPNHYTTTAKDIIPTKQAIAKNLKRVSVPRFSFTTFLVPELANYRLENDETNVYDNKQAIAKREKTDVSFSGGMLIGYDVSRRFSLHTGIGFTTSNIKIDPLKVYAIADNNGNIQYRYNTSSGYGYLKPSFSTSPLVGDSLYTTSADHILQFINIPVIAKYHFGNKRLSFNPGVGISFNFLTRASLSTDVLDRFNRENETITKLQGLQKTSYSLVVTPEMQYRLKRNWLVSVTPSLKYALAPINKGNVVKTYPYHIGVGIGLVRRF